MSTTAETIIRIILMGIGATLTFDLWALFLKRAFGIPMSNICLVGRWVAYLAEGILRHSNIATSPARRSECLLGWVAHYAIGTSFAMVFAFLMGRAWLQHPTLLPAVLFGVVTVLAPFLILQPLFGFGIAATKTPNPGQARWRSLMNHAAFGFGLYVFGVVTGWIAHTS